MPFTFPISLQLVDMMLLPQITLLFSLLPLALAVSNTTTTALQWGPCRAQTNASVPISCTTLKVPRDYLSNSTSTIRLNLAKINATKQPPQGTVLYNPGGPGDGGRNTLFLDWTQLIALASSRIETSRDKLYLTPSPVPSVHITTSSHGILGQSWLSISLPPRIQPSC